MSLNELMIVFLSILTKLVYYRIFILNSFQLFNLFNFLNSVNSQSSSDTLKKLFNGLFVLEVNFQKFRI